MSTMDDARWINVRWHRIISGVLMMMISWQTNGSAQSIAQGSQSERTRVTDFLTYDPAKHLAYLSLHAGRDGDNGGMSFNGVHGGAQTIVLPVGWRVDAVLVNDDNALPHSVTVISDRDSIPALAGMAAFVGATSENAQEGTVTGEQSRFSFKADHSGKFLVICAVPGHAQAGMYLRLLVSEVDRTPRVQ